MQPSRKERRDGKECSLEAQMALVINNVLQNRVFLGVVVFCLFCVFVF